MTLSSSSFSIKDILTGRDGKTGSRSKEEFCAGDGGARAYDLFNQESEGDSIHPQRLYPDLRLPAGNLRSEIYREEATRGERGHREGETFSLVFCGCTFT